MARIHLLEVVIENNHAGGNVKGAEMSALPTLSLETGRELRWLPKAKHNPAEADKKKQTTPTNSSFTVFHISLKLNIFITRNPPPIYFFLFFFLGL